MLNKSQVTSCDRKMKNLGFTWHDQDCHLLEEKEKKWKLRRELPCDVSFPHISEVKQTYSRKKNNSTLVK